ncbi:MAG: hypothetical protein E6G95_13455 [Alphaproteobacteria bacterium]|nr:MAG: hypothetical protein E6G95_13455 [Alphaproteobacteria bacterium]
MERSLVRFEQTPSPAPLWAEAGHDASAFGAALDRVFGEPRDIHLIQHFASAGEAALVADDPLVVLANLIDGLGLPMADSVPASMPELAAVYDFAAADGFNTHDHWVYDAHA